MQKERKQQDRPHCRRRGRQEKQEREREDRTHQPHSSKHRKAASRLDNRMPACVKQAGDQHQDYRCSIHAINLSRDAIEPARCTRDDLSKISNAHARVRKWCEREGRDPLDPVQNRKPPEPARYRQQKQRLIHHPRALPISAVFGLRYVHTLVRKWAASGAYDCQVPEVGTRPGEW
jgi:hypothetical protein